MKALTILTITSSLLFAFVASQCNQCLENKVLCIDETRFVYCFGNNVVGNDIQTCAQDTVCTQRPAICLPQTPEIQPACPAPPDQGRSCSMCSTTHQNNFACINEEMFSRCSEEGNPDFTYSGSCPDGMVCNIGYEGMCVSRSLYTPSCYTTTNVPVISGDTTTQESQTDQTPDITAPQGNPIIEDPSTTQESQTDQTPDVTATTNHITGNPPSGETTTPQPSSTPITTLSPNNQCTAHNAVGYYPVGNDCSRYLACSYRDGELRGEEFACPMPSYFNPTSQKCAISRPPVCPEHITTPSTTLSPNPSLSPIPSTTTTVNPAVQLCTDKGGVGRYPYNNSCTQYLTCSSINGQLHGGIESCPKGSYYNQTTAKCSLVQPTGCVQ